MSNFRPVGVSELCWTEIGVWGDRTCPELSKVGHCHNCDVYRQRGNQLLDRPVPADYLEFWTDLVARKKDLTSTKTTPYLVFRLGLSWVGLKALVLREVMHCGIVRTIPHRRSGALLGLTAVRGEISPCISLHSLTGESQADSSGVAARFLVANAKGGDWVFPVDEVSGIYHIEENSIGPVPATLAHADKVYTSGIAQCGDRSVGLLDEDALFGAIQRGIA